jgi:hypothetical protein
MDCGKQSTFSGKAKAVEDFLKKLVKCNGDLIRLGIKLCRFSTLSFGPQTINGCDDTDQRNGLRQVAPNGKNAQMPNGLPLPRHTGAKFEDYLAYGCLK